MVNRINARVLIRITIFNNVEARRPEVNQAAVDGDSRSWCKSRT